MLYLNYAKRVEFRENVRAFFPQGQSKLSIITRCPLRITELVKVTRCISRPYYTLTMTCLFSSAFSDSKLNSGDHPLARTAVTVAELLEYIYK